METKNERRNWRRILSYLLAVVCWILIWWIASAAVGKDRLFPSPGTVVQTLFRLAGTADFYLAILLSLRNVVTGILLGLVTGCLLSLLSSRFRVVRAFLLPPMNVIKSTPVASFIILALIWVGAPYVPTLITFLIVLPIVWGNLDTGFSRIDPQLREVAGIYRLSPLRRFRILTVPSLKPFFLSACRSSLGLAWKAGIAAEIIAPTPGNIGAMISDAKQYILTAETFAWTVTVILLSLLIEVVFTALFGKIAESGNRKEVADHA